MHSQESSRPEREPRARRTNRGRPGTATKASIAASVAERTGVNRTLAAEATDQVLNAIAEALLAGRRVELRGFGVFGTTVRAARPARDPRTGREVVIPARRVVRFKAGKLLVDVLNDATAQEEAA
jgi:DNA-binding protein HU-beta